MVVRAIESVREQWTGKNKCMLTRKWALLAGRIYATVHFKDLRRFSCIHSKGTPLLPVVVYVLTALVQSIVHIYWNWSPFEVPYLPVYKSIPCISRPPILEAKKKFFLFLGENFLEKLILYLRTFFHTRYSYAKKNHRKFGRKSLLSRVR